LDMSPADFATYVDNARLSIPTKTEELSPEQKRAKDEEQFRADRLAFEKEQSAFRYQTIASNYIRDNIAPVLQDKDKFELIHTAGLNDMQNYIYEFMNKHYNETKEVLSAQDVAETIENQLYQNSIQAIEANRKVKKLAKLFASQEEEVKVAVDEMAEAPGRQTRPSFVEPTLTNKQARPLDTRFPTRDEELNASSEEEAEEAEPNTNTVSKRKSVGSDIPFALLSRAERLARMKAEQR